MHQNGPVESEDPLIGQPTHDQQPSRRRTLRRIARYLSASNDTWIRALSFGIIAILVTAAIAIYITPIVKGDNTGNDGNSLRLWVETDASEEDGYSREPHISFALTESGSLRFSIRIESVDTKNRHPKGQGLTVFSVDRYTPVRAYLFDTDGRKFTVQCSNNSHTEWISDPSRIGGAVGKHFTNIWKNTGSNFHADGFSISADLHEGSGLGWASLQPGHPYNSTQGFDTSNSDNPFMDGPSQAENALTCIVRDSGAVNIQRRPLGTQIERIRFNPPMVAWARNGIPNCPETKWSCWRTPSDELTHPALRTMSTVKVPGPGAFELASGSEGFTTTGPKTFRSTSSLSELTQYCSDYACLQDTHPTALIENARLEANRNLQWLLIGLLIGPVLALWRIPLSYLWRRAIG